MIGIGLNLAYVVIQLAIGFKINSLSLISDAGHNFLDVAGLVLAMVAFKLSTSKGNDKYTYGYKKASILISLFNAVILLISIGAIGFEAILRFRKPEILPGNVISWVALIGIFINGFSAFVFFRNKEEDLNIKAAFLHLAADTLVSLGLVVGGIIIYYTHLYWVDPLLSIIICIVILTSTWSLLKDSLVLSLDGVPKNIEIEKIKSVISKHLNVINLHHIHIWAISTTENAMTAHIVVEDNLPNKELSDLISKIKHELLHLSIHHSTFEIEYQSQSCHEQDCESMH